MISDLVDHNKRALMKNLKKTKESTVNSNKFRNNFPSFPQSEGEFQRNAQSPAISKQSPRPQRRENP